MTLFMETSGFKKGDAQAISAASVDHGNRSGTVPSKPENPSEFK
ncbi:hypothetical protein [Rhizobium bangladeshense]|nr:hypothetical protein [Rhizobium bangladeshense]